MNKSDLINKIAEDAELSNAAAKRALDSALQAIQEALKEGESVVILGFGTFSATKKSERVGRNPQTGEEMTIAARTVPRFSPGATLKKAMAGN